MAKIRVYELARDLNMKNKAMLQKLEEMNISVSSHMSSLEDDAVARIKADVLGKKNKAAKEDRSKSRIIRRRRKGIDSDDVSEENDDDDENEDMSETAETPEKTSPDEPVESSVKRPPETKDTQKKKRKKIKDKNKKAKVVRLPQEPEKDKAADKAGEPSESNKISQTAKSPEPAQETFDTSATPEAQHPSERSSDMSEKKSKKTEETPAQSENPDKPLEEKSETKPASKKKKRKKKAKKEKDMPAKIIKLPPKPVKKPVKADNVPQEKVKKVASNPENMAAEKEKVAKGKRKKKGAESPAGAGKENRWAKKKISFKRKEVVEGAALYDGSRGKKGKRGRVKATKSQKTQITTPKAIKRRVKVDETIILSDLAKRMGIKANEMIKKLMMMGVMVTVNQTIDFDTAVLVASEFGYEVENSSFEEETILNIDKETDSPESLVYRSPVVTIMGHVDHGKTSLLDVIRKTRVTEIEAGGITQHIGAYSVKTERGQITFLDTPGHEAFTSMRARGATVTDIVVLVVAADDGVMPQTVEAINHSKAANVPIIVAINKMDKAGANPDRVLRELSEHNLMSEDWGGDTIFVQVSAKMNQGIDELLEMILLQAEVLELRANPDKHAKGYVVESKLDSGRGPVATILIQEGTLHNGAPVVCGLHHGKVRAMLNDRGKQVDSAGPSVPVEVIGLSGVPNSGDEMIALDDDKSAKQVSEYRLQKQRGKELAKTSRMSLDKLFEKMKQGEVKDLNVILKADVHGSIEALRDSLVKLSNEEVNIRVIHSGTGTVTESDIALATVSNAIIIGFNVRPSAKIQALANEEHVDMRFYNVIYSVIKDVKDAILGMMDSTYEERVLGMADVRQVFHVPKVGAIAGCYVTNGSIQRGKKIRLLREGVIIHEGNISSLRRFKDDAKEVQTGYECGIGIENYNDIKLGDVIECFYLEEIKPELS